jgi:transcriptional regulator GlxA family with amidase domain
VRCHRRFDQIRRTDLVLVPALGDDPVATLGTLEACLPWLRRMHAHGADIASICTGAFLLAEAGLLAGRKATTHWVAQELFEHRYPDVALLRESIIVDEGSVITSGGATTFLNLLMYLVEKYCGQETARQACRVFLIDQGRGPQTSFAIFSTQKSHGDGVVLRAQQVMESRHRSPLSVSTLASELGVSRRSLERRFRAATGNSPGEYLQRVRVESAKKALEATDSPVSEIAQAVGYGDVPSFRKLFARSTGLSPARYRRRYASSSPYVSRPVAVSPPV